MIRRALYLIAGVDRDTLASCPATDKLWAVHLGVSLLLSFIVVLAITFHATGYIFDNPWTRMLVAVVVALTLFMFDRALYQSDWFLQGGFRTSVIGEHPDRWAALRRFFRITIRLSISIGLAWVIAVFLELAIFSDTINDKITRDHVAINQPLYAKIDQYEAQLAAEIEQRRSNLIALEELYRRDLAAEPTTPVQPDDLEPRIQALDEQIKFADQQQQELRRDLAQVESRIAGYLEEMNAEQTGRRINGSSSGRAGTGPRYQFALQQKGIYEARRTTLQNEVSEWRTRRSELTSAQQRLMEEAAARREGERVAFQTSHTTKREQVETARTELRDLERSRLTKVEEFRRQMATASDFQKLKNDPLARMTAYQELKNDPKDGATITLFSWMTKFLVIFLEVVPIVAKMFFSPPSVYAAKIQAEVAREQEKIRFKDDQVGSGLWTQNMVPVTDSALMPVSGLGTPVAKDPSEKRKPDVADRSTAPQVKAASSIGREMDLLINSQDHQDQPNRRGSDSTVLAMNNAPDDALLVTKVERNLSNLVPDLDASVPFSDRPAVSHAGRRNLQRPRS